MSIHRLNGRPSWRAILYSGITAGIVATVVQVLLWLAFSADLPQILYRDARLAAAIVLGPGVLPPPAGFDAGIWLVATLVHFALSVTYAAALLFLTARLTRGAALLAGAVFGVALYAVNLYGFTAVFPWFAQARSWITLVAHVTFGIAAVCAWRCRNSGMGDAH